MCTTADFVFSELESDVIRYGEILGPIEFLYGFEQYEDVKKVGAAIVSCLIDQGFLVPFEKPKSVTGTPNLSLEEWKMAALGALAPIQNFEDAFWTHIFWFEGTEKAIHAGRQVLANKRLMEVISDDRRPSPLAYKKWTVEEAVARELGAISSISNHS